jgi:hypothetical protein
MAGAAGAKSISWLIRAGDDFPEECKDQICFWGVNSIIQLMPQCETPKGFITYKDATLGCTSNRSLQKSNSIANT